MPSTIISNPIYQMIDPPDPETLTLHYSYDILILDLDVVEDVVSSWTHSTCTG
jgi:hypothetical protein